jgi:RsiW-degrading membrane proteinase PrsW (M82 family)
MKRLAAWLLVISTFVVGALISFFPIMFLLAETPMHDGSDSPSPLMLYTTLFISLFVGLVLSVVIYRWSFRAKV